MERTRGGEGPEGTGIALAQVLLARTNFTSTSGCGGGSCETKTPTGSDDTSVLGKRTHLGSWLGVIAKVLVVVFSPVDRVMPVLGRTVLGLSCYFANELLFSVSVLTWDFAPA